MRWILILIITALISVSCVSVKKYNSQINNLRSESELKNDVDFAYRKLKKLHPDLYWYISKHDLDFKFDSLKSTINSPMTSNDFYMKLGPVISSVKQGHMRLIPLNKKLNRKERQVAIKSGTTPFSKLEFELFNNKLFIVKNYSADSTIRTGTELVSVNGSSPIDLISKYRKTFSSDGFNQTFIPRRSAKYFPQFFYYANDVTDSALCELKYHDTTRTYYLKRKPVNNLVKKENPVKKSTLELKKEREKNNQEMKKRNIQGYDRLTGTYSKNLSFYEPDSSIALMKINDFAKGRYKKFYRNSFNQLDSLKTRILIIDLRDNPGGRLYEIYNLYSYLTDKDFQFLDRSEVVSRTSLLYNNYFRRGPLTLILGLPAELIYSGIVFLKVKKGADNKFYYKWNSSRMSHAKPNNFKGKIYVLINGGSFSASCLLSSNLKGPDRAVFAGEETGGAYNGTVAGMIPLVKLPKSKLNIRLGLARITPHYKTDTEGHGIFPDFEIKPTLEDRLSGNDPELSFVLNEIRNSKPEK
jgi:C-terminal processing protease CtpA/Prc